MSDPQCGRIVIGDGDAGLSATTAYPADKNLDNIVRKGPIRPKVDINGHSVDFRDGKVKCLLCDFEEDIPDLVRQSSGFRQVVYKLFLVSTLTDYVCDHSDVDPGTQPNSNIVPSPGTYTIDTTNIDDAKLDELKHRIASDLNRQVVGNSRKI